MVPNWDSFVCEHGPVLFATAWRILGQAEDAEDVVQEVFLELFRTRHTSGVQHRPELLRRLTAFRSLDRLRRRRLAPVLDSLSVPDCHAGPDAVAIGRELAERLRAAVVQLPEQESAVFCLRYFEDLSYQQIADTLNISPGAVATALHKARAKLETRLCEVVQGE
jgi:RNA polymerase sigma-70 factor (ECF subfamily)